jgi:dipeptidyl-peptidase 9
MDEPINPALLKALVRGRQAQSAGQAHSFAFTDSNTVVFLAADPKSPSFPPATSLHAVRISPTEASNDGHFYDPEAPAVPWTPMLPTSTATSRGQPVCEAELCRDRDCSTTQGIQYYKTDANTLLLPLDDGLYVAPFPAPPTADDPRLLLPPPLCSITAPPSALENPLCAATKTYFDATLSPDGILVAFVRDDDLWALDVASGAERRLTYSENPTFADWQPTHHQGQHKQSYSARQPTRAEYSQMARAAAEKNDPLSASVRRRSCGVPDHIAQEEFCLTDGFWWRPGGRNPVTGNYELLYLSVEHDPSTIVQLPTFQTPSLTPSDTERFHYPRPGQKNSIAEPAIVSFPPPPPVHEDSLLDEWASADPRDVADQFSWAPAFPVRSQYPWSEYIVRAGWLDRDEYMSDTDRRENGVGAFWLQLLDRRQKRLGFVVLPSGGVVAAGICILSVMSSGTDWINVNNAYRLLTKQSAVIFCSETSGFARLYLKDLTNLRVSSTEGRATEDAGNVLPGVVRLITDTRDQPSPSNCWSGLAYSNWDVEDVEFVDEDRELVYFTRAYHDTALVRHLYYASYATGANPLHCFVLIRDAYWSTNTAFDSAGTRFVATTSSMSSRPCTTIYDICFERRVLSAIPVAVILNPPPHSATHVPWPLKAPELFTFTTEDGTTVDGALYRPHPSKCGDSAGPAPTILQVYAGPGVQTVRRDWAQMMQLKTSLLVERGYAVVMIDGRGSARRGREFAGVFGRSGFGDVELRDQVLGIEALVKRGFVDPKRIAVSGWSYGGYAALMLLTKYPDLFRMAIAGAPVISWEGYDAAYTERYLGLIDENPLNYSKSSVLSYIHSFPDQRGRLLLVASARDENVHCSQTVALVDSLIEHNKPHDFVMFPKENHSLRSASAQLHFERMFFDFIRPLKVRGGD